jgi:hypothetical protein
MDGSMRLLILTLACFVVLGTAVEAGAATAEASSQERPAGSLDSLLLTGGEVIRGVVIHEGADGVVVRLA